VRAKTATLTLMIDIFILFNNIKIFLRCSCAAA